MGANGIKISYKCPEYIGIPWWPVSLQDWIGEVSRSSRHQIFSPFGIYGPLALTSEEYDVIGEMWTWKRASTNQVMIFVKSAMATQLLAGVLGNDIARMDFKSGWKAKIRRDPANRIVRYAGLRISEQVYEAALGTGRSQMHRRML